MTNALAPQVLRSGQRVSLDIPLSQPRELVPPTLGGKPPQYVILSGFAFAAFSVPFMYDFDPADNTPKNAAFWGLIDSLQSGQPAFEGEEVVVLAGGRQHRRTQCFRGGCLLHKS